MMDLLESRFLERTPGYFLNNRCLLWLICSCVVYTIDVLTNSINLCELFPWCHERAFYVLQVEGQKLFRVSIKNRTTTNDASSHERPLIY
jgi:hypothetical protein